MAMPLSLSEEERGRVMRMTAAALDLLSAEAARRDGISDEADALLLERRKQNLVRIDVALALDLADRLGEYALREAMEEYTPRNARASVDALVKINGGMLPVVKTRIERMRSAGGMTTLSDEFGCGLGAIAVVAGVVGNGFIGGVLAVGGIMLMAECC